MGLRVPTLLQRFPRETLAAPIPKHRGPCTGSPQVWAPPALSSVRAPSQGRRLRAEAGGPQGFRSHSEGEIGSVPRPRPQETVERDRPQFPPPGVETKPESPRLAAPPEVAPGWRGPPRPCPRGSQARVSGPFLADEPVTPSPAPRQHLCKRPRAEAPRPPDPQPPGWAPGGGTRANSWSLEGRLSRDTPRWRSGLGSGEEQRAKVPARPRAPAPRAPPVPLARRAAPAAREGPFWGGRGGRLF